MQNLKLGLKSPRLCKNGTARLPRSPPNRARSLSPNKRRRPLQAAEKLTGRHKLKRFVTGHDRGTHPVSGSRAEKAPKKDVGFSPCRTFLHSKTDLLQQFSAQRSPRFWNTAIIPYPIHTRPPRRSLLSLHTRPQKTSGDLHSEIAAPLSRPLRAPIAAPSSTSPTLRRSPLPSEPTQTCAPPQDLQTSNQMPPYRLPSAHIASSSAAPAPAAQASRDRT